MAKKKNDSKDGVLTKPFDTKSKDYENFQIYLSERFGSLDEKQKRKIELIALRVKIEDYLNSNIEVRELISVGDFLRLYLDKLQIKQNQLAKYIGLKPSNFNKILTGSRKVNFELSFILGRLFNLNPNVWMLIQLKNDFTKLKTEKSEEYQQYKLEDLVSM